MKKIILILCLLFLSFNTYSAPLIIDPGTPLRTHVGPDPWHGRGFVFRAEENFSIASLGMDLNFTGTQDFRIAVYANDGTAVGGRGALISETLHPGLTDDGSVFFALTHAQSFTTGNFYELLIQYTDGVGFNYYNFENPELDPIKGFAAGSSMLILDGTDFDNYTINQWLVRFQIDGDLGPPSTTYSVGGTVAGLTGSVTLQNNGGDDIIKTTNDGFTFATQTEGSDYAVTVSSQPSGQTCTVTNGSGTNITANITNVTVTCVTDIVPTYSVGGTVSGLTGTGLALQNNGAEILSIAADGLFAFLTELVDTAAYTVIVSTQPTGQTCTVTNGSGAIAVADINNVSVACVDDVAPPAPVVPVPTLSQWALILFSMLLGLMVFANRRRLF